jgi:hypothetical protein
MIVMPVRPKAGREPVGRRSLTTGLRRRRGTTLHSRPLPTTAA